MWAGTGSRNVMLEQRKRMRLTSCFVCGVIKEKRPLFQRKQRFLVKAYGFIEISG